MRIGFDLDGCLSNFTLSFIQIVNGIWPGRISLKYIVKDWDFADVIAKDEWPIIWNKIENTSFFWYDLKPLPGVSDLQKFAKRHTDYEFYFITARQKTGELSAEVQTKMWLMDYDLFPMLGGRSRVKAVGNAKDKCQWIENFQLDYYLDDYAPTIQNLQNIHRTKSYLLSTNYNRGAQLPKVNTIAEYLKLIEDQSNGIMLGL